MISFLLLTAIVIFTCVFLNRISDRLGIPVLLAFILLGMFFGSDGPIQVPFENYNFAEQICSTGLIFIMFYGGFGTNWSMARPVLSPAILLSSLGVILTALLTCAFIHWGLGQPWLLSLLMGSVMASTDAASVFSILRSKILNLKYNTASLLEVESGSNDPTAFMMTMICISLMQGTADGWSTLGLLFSQIIFGLAFGFGIAFIAKWALKKTEYLSGGFDMVFLTAIAIFSYAAPSIIDGNGYLSCYITGIILGNSEFRGKRNIVHFFDGATNLIQMMIFFLLGLLSTPSELPEVAWMAFLIAFVLTCIIRPIAVFGLMLPFRVPVNAGALISFAGLRGASAIVFAIVAYTQAPVNDIVFHVTFFVVLLSILFQGAFLPLVSKKLDMIDDSHDVMKSFTDYAEEIPVQFIEFTLPAGHIWCNQLLKDITLPPQTLAVLLCRGDHKIIPDGHTLLREDDTLVLSALSVDPSLGIKLNEIHVTEDSPYYGKSVASLRLPKGCLIILIVRNQNVVIPEGNTILNNGDILVINEGRS